MCAITAAALWYYQGGSVWYVGGITGAWPLVLLASGFIAHILSVRFRIRLHAVDIAILLFFATALLGVGVAYDPDPAWAKLGLIAGAIGLYYAFSHQNDGLMRYLTYVFLGVFGIGLSLYFYVTNDWSGAGYKLPWLFALSQRFTSIMPSVVSHRMHPNVVGGMLAVIIPFYVPLIQLSPQTGAVDGEKNVPRLLSRPGLLWFVPMALCIVTLFFTASRGAWVALLIMSVLWLIWRAQGGWLKNRSRQLEHQWRLRLGTTGVIIIVGLVLLFVGAVVILTRHLPGYGALSSRVDLLQNALHLARDYFFTGAGLGMFEVQFSIYTLLIHVSYIVHSHNILLNVLTEQGIVGLISIIAILAGGISMALRRLRNASGQNAWLLETSIVAIGIILIHGMVDDAFYGSRGLLLLFIPIALIIRIPQTTSAEQSSGVGISKSWRPVRAAVAGVALVGLVAAIVGLIPSVRAMLLANLGAVEQSRIELSMYDQSHVDRATIDQVRQHANLEHAIGLFNQALQQDGGNITARQRLSMIAMARRDYAEGLVQIQAAWDAGYRDSTTRLLLGDAYIADGNPHGAFNTIKELLWARDRLTLQATYRYAVNNEYQRSADAWAVVVLLAPDDTNAVRAQKEAQKRAEERR